MLQWVTLFPHLLEDTIQKKSKGKKIFVFIGDGGLMMNLQELEYIKNFRIPIKIVVLNNRCLGNTKLGSILSFNGRTHANDKKKWLLSSKYQDISKAFNFKYFEFTNGSKTSLKKNLGNLFPLLVPLCLIYCFPKHKMLQNYMF